MSISVTADKTERRSGTLIAVETLTQGSATTWATMTVLTDQVLLSGGTTSTAFDQNKYQLAATGVADGSEKVIIMTATGHAHLYLADATATGLYVMTASDDMMKVQLLAGQWRVIQSSATIAAST